MEQLLNGRFEYEVPHLLLSETEVALTLDAVEAKFGSLLPGLKWLNFGGGHHITRPDYDMETLERCIRRAQREDELFSTLDENPDFTAPAETPSGQAESRRPSEG